jgi:hypothetical protein
MGAEVVDSIVANLELRYQQYVEGYKAVIAVRDRDTKSLIANAAAQKSADAAMANRRSGGADGDVTGRKRAAKGASDAEKAAAKSAADAVKQAARDKAAAEKAAAKAASDAVKAAEREKQAALKATRREQERASQAAKAKAVEAATAAAAATAATEREVPARARLAAVVERSAARSGPLPQAVGGRVGATVPREATGQRSIPLSQLNGVSSDAVAVSEVNHLLADQADLQARLAVVTGQDKAQVRDKVQELRYIKQLQSAGLDEAAIALRLDERALLIARERAATERKIQDAQLGSFAKGAGLGRIGGSAAAIGGIAVAAGVGISAEVVQNAADYAKELSNVSKQLGLTTDQTQVYEAAARAAGATEEQFRTGLGQLQSYLGRAQSGGEEEAKTFTALGVSIKGVASAGELLPTLIDRISSIEDPARRAALETRLFGEEGRKLDGLLAGGNDKINELAQALISTGAVLSGGDIQRLDVVSKKLAEVKAQLQVDLAEIVAGNSDAILGLAKSFSALVTEIKDAINWIGAYNSQRLKDLTPGGGSQPLAPGFVQRLETGAEGFVRRQFTRATTPTLTADVMTDQARASLARFRTPDVQGGSVNQGLLDRLNAPKPTKGPKGKTAEQLANEESQRTRRFNDIMGRYEDEQQRAAAEQTQSEYERSDIEKRQIDRDLAREKDDLRLRSEEDIRKGADRKITESRLAQAVSAAEAAAAERKNVISLRDTIEAQGRDNAKRSREISRRSEDLQQADSLARTQAERRRVADARRQNDRDRETNDANFTILRGENGDPTVSTSDLQGARETLSTQDKRFAKRKQADDASTAGPLESYLRDAPRSIEQLNERFEEAAVDGIGRLNDSLADTATKFLHLHGLAGQFINDLIRIGLEKLTADLIGGATGGSGGGGFGGAASGAGGIANGIGNLVNAFGHILGGKRATGGNVVGGVPYLVGENGPEIRVDGMSGRVYPNGSLPGIATSAGGGTTLHQTFHIDASGVNPSGFADGIISSVRQETMSAIRQSSAATLNAAPARVQRVSTLGT